MRSEVKDGGLDQPEKGSDWPERVEVPNNLDRPIKRGGDWLENNLDWPREEGGNWLGNDLDWPMEEGSNLSENNDNQPREDDNQEGEEDQPKEGNDITEEEDLEVLPVELEEPPMFIANKLADKIENILEEDTEGVTNTAAYLQDFAHLPRNLWHKEGQETQIPLIKGKLY